MRLLAIFTFLISQATYAAEDTLSSCYKVAKENCHSIPSLREEMDNINNEILLLLAKRIAYVKRAGDLKYQTIKIADDRQRVAEQERKIIEKALELELPLEIILPTFRSLVETSIEVQQNYIDQLNASLP